VSAVDAAIRSPSSCYRYFPRPLPATRYLLRRISLHNSDLRLAADSRTCPAQLHEDCLVPHRAGLAQEKRAQTSFLPKVAIATRPHFRTMNPPEPLVSNFNPVTLGSYIRYLAESKKRRHFVTLLIGAGFSKSAGIPLASEIVQELRSASNEHPLLCDVGSAPPDISDYAFLMEKLGSPKERANYIKDFVDRARDSKGRLKINWSHLLLATLVEKGYVNRILTTNFDPLIVEALAVSGQPIRTYDLNTTGKYCPGTLDSASIIYLHGQMHSLFLANSKDEMARLRDLYPKVLQEAVQDSILIVIGYSGECDPVLDSLMELPNFPLGLWWVHYSPAGDPPGAGARKVFSKHGTDCHLAQGEDSDTFMRKLVLDGMKLDLPDEVLKPVTAIKLALERITPFPKQDIQAPDPVLSALEMLRKVELQLSNPAPSLVKPQKGEQDDGFSADSSGDSPTELAQAMPLEMASLNGDWDEFDRLRVDIKPNVGSKISSAIGDGLVRRASQKNTNNEPDAALRLLEEAIQFGVSSKMRSWLPTTWGNSLSDKAKIKGPGQEAESLFKAAYEKYAEAIQINGEMHEAFYNWGNALLEHSEIKNDSVESDALLVESGKKFSQALNLKSDKHEAWNNWGVALVTRAKKKGSSPQADDLFKEAFDKYTQALVTKPDKHETLHNWGNGLSKQAEFKAGAEAYALLLEAEKKFAEAVRIKPEKHESLVGWGNVLVKRAKLKIGTSEAGRLFSEAFGKFSEALRIQPNNENALTAWAVALVSQAMASKSDKESESLFSDAKAKYHEILNKSPENYTAFFNLACLEAQRNNIDEALGYLKKWKMKNPNARKADLDSDSDFESIKQSSEFLKFRSTLPI